MINMINMLIKFIIYNLITISSNQFKYLTQKHKNFVHTISLLCDINIYTKIINNVIIVYISMMDIYNYLLFNIIFIYINSNFLIS